MMLGVYVDGGKAKGCRSQVLWALAQKVEIGCPQLCHHFLGVHSKCVRREHMVFRFYQQSAYIGMFTSSFRRGRS